MEPVADFVAKITTLSFTGPSTVNYRSNKAWDEDHASYYTPTVVLNKPLAVDMEITVKVMEERNNAANPHLGTMKVKFAAGQTVGVARTENNTDARLRGFPAVTQKKFWLVATKANRIKGSVGKGDDEHADVYLEAFGKFRTVGGKTYLVSSENAAGNNKRSAEKSIHTT
jgi:hypothetical protein